MENSRVVEVVTATTMAELRAHRDRARASLVELRLDYVTDLDVAGALEGRTTPVIVTIRPTWEGGRFAGSEEERLRLLSHAAALGAEFVDIEWKAARPPLDLSHGTQVVLSSHDFEGIPRDLADRVRAMRAENPAVVKVAVMPAHLRDCLALLALRPAGDSGPAHLAIGMGAAGEITRVCPWMFGSCWTYSGASAPGQLGIADLLDSLRVERASAATQIYAVTGVPLAHSASPAMHNAALGALGLDGIYVRLETADIDELLDVASALDVAGISVTAPIKPAAFARARHLDPLGASIGAINTLRRGADGWEGRNYDVAGFLRPLEQRAVPLDGRRAVVLGAGGAARTVVWALRSKGTHVTVTARREERARALATEFGVETTAWPPEAGWDLLVNTTPVGTWPKVTESPLDEEHVRGACVYDLIYNPPETKLLTSARAGGADTVGGLDMLVSQAALQFAWWTGHEAPTSVMEEAARAFLARGQG
jgi:3-dehydroquinate dehydratase/shikimate dehydrogenase